MISLLDAVLTGGAAAGSAGSAGFHTLPNLNDSYPSILSMAQLTIMGINGSSSLS